VAIGPAHGEDADTLLRRADVAMYSAKGRRIGSAVYEPRLDRYSPERLAVAGELRHAIARGELSLHYQPQVEPRTGRVDAVEALVRWNHPERGLIGPTEFVPLAERTGLIRPLTLWVLEAAIRECSAWRRAGVDLHVSVNLSTANLVDTELPNAIEGLLRQWAVPPEYLRLEITESTAMADPVRTRAVLARLNALGTPLAIDDFGTGYSSLAYLRSLPVRELKIDRSFVSRMTSTSNDAAIVVATIDLAHTLGLRVVAEGVEDLATLQALMRRGCDLVQGYFVARPLAVAELRQWLAAWPGSPWTGAARPTVVVPELPVLSVAR
jgi:EAL domain-containing protein (putative c-di-GMP-specific phosphodiesterase class I)